MRKTFVLFMMVLALGVAAGDATARPTTGKPIFTGSAAGHGECSLASTESYVCTFEGRFRGTLQGIARSGRFQLSVYVEEIAGGAPAPAIFDGNVTKARVRLMFAATKTQPARTVGGGPTAAGTMTPNADKGLDLATSIPIGKSRISINVIGQVKWELSEFDASKNEVSIETLEIAHEGLN